MEYLEHTGALAGLPTRIVAILQRRGVRTRADLAVWYRAEVARAAATRGIGPRALRTIAAWLGECEEGAG